jgi:hypothetical protein
MRRLLLALSCAAIAATASATDLTGTVVDAAAQPVAGAQIFVYAAYPKLGVSAFCPTCYRDCGKHQPADTAGAFRIEDLNGTLRFDVLAMADGYESALVNRFDPSSGPLKVRLTRRSAEEAVRLVSGRVLDPAGKPVPGAVVTTLGYHRGDGVIVYGNSPGVEKLSVTNLNGEFSLRLASPSGKVDVRVQGRSLAKHVERALVPGEHREIRLTDGATITGHVTRGGQPLPGTRVVLVQQNRASSGYLGSDEIATNDDGLFVFTSITPGQKYFVYAAMAGLAGGYVAPKLVTAGTDGEVLDAGTLPVVRGRRIAGTIVLPAGATLPPDTELRLVHFASDDSVAMPVPASGQFAFDDVPFEEMELLLTIPGFQRALATLGPRDNPRSIEIAAGNDCTDVRVVLEKNRR